MVEFGVVTGQFGWAAQLWRKWIAALQICEKNLYQKRQINFMIHWIHFYRAFLNCSFSINAWMEYKLLPFHFYIALNKQYLNTASSFVVYSDWQSFTFYHAHK